MTHATTARLDALDALTDARIELMAAEKKAAARIASDIGDVDLDALEDDALDAHFMAEEMIRNACGCYAASSAVINAERATVNAGAAEIAANRLVPRDSRAVAAEAARTPGSRAWQMMLANIERWGDRPMQTA